MAAAASPPPRPLVMGVLNCTPDSFSDGAALSAEAFAAKGLALIAEGADLLDIGGESSRPGARPVDEAEELRRIVPVLRAIRRESALPLSVDTRRAAVAEAALAEGASIVNDISAGADPRMFAVVAQSSASYVAMHMQGTPETMQQAPAYGADLVADILDFLRARTRLLLDKGMAPGKIWWDPGIGFGKTLQHNLDILRQLERFTALHPVVLGVSRKSFITGLSRFAGRPAERLGGSLAPLGLAAAAGVRAVRVHDVAATRQYFDVLLALHSKEIRP